MAWLKQSKNKGARSRYVKQFQHWSNCLRINLNIKITAQNYRRTRTEHKKDKKGRGWTKLEGIEVDCIWINLENIGPPFLQIYGISVYTLSNFHYHSWKIIHSCYVAMILQMEDSWSASLTFRVHN